MNARRQIASIIAIATVAWPAVSPAEAPGQAECLKALMASLAETYQPAPRLRDASFGRDPRGARAEPMRIDSGRPFRCIRLMRDADRRRSV